MAETSNATAEWPASVEKKLIVILLEEKDGGNVSTGQVQRKRWPHVINKFKNQTGKSYSNKQIREKFKQLKKSYGELRQLLEITELKWDFVTKTVTGSEDAWTYALKLNSGWSTFRNKRLANYELVGQLLSTAAQTFSAQPVSADDVHEQDSNPEGKQSALSETLTQEKKRKTVSFDIATESPIVIKTAQDSNMSMTKVTRILESMQISMQISKDTMFKALVNLEKHETRESFFSMDLESRQGWVVFLAENFSRNNIS